MGDVVCSVMLVEEPGMISLAGFDRREIQRFITTLRQRAAIHSISAYVAVIAHFIFAFSE